MQITLSTSDLLGSSLSAATARLADPRPVLEAMALAVVSEAKEAFRNSSARPLPWAPRKGPGSHNLLLKSGSLWHSIRVAETTSARAVVASDRPYAAVHQFGSRKSQGRGSGIPPRPYMPFGSDGRPTPRIIAAARSAAEAKLRSLGFR